MASHLDRLVDGFRRFRGEHYGANRALFERLVRQGQAPKTVMVGCCDSRVDPALLTDCDPGDVFIIRNVANLVPPFESSGSYHGTSAALEFGVRALGVESVVVLGHSQCGGIRELLRLAPGNPPLAEEGFIGGWMKVASHARNRVLSRMPGEPLEQQARACEQEAIRVSLDNLLTFPWVLERVAQKRLTLHGWYFDLAQGALLRLDPESNRFEAFS